MKLQLYIEPMINPYGGKSMGTLIAIRLISATAQSCQMGVKAHCDQFELFYNSFDYLEIPFDFNQDNSYNINYIKQGIDRELISYLFYDNEMPDYYPYEFFPEGKFRIAQDIEAILLHRSGGAGGLESYFDLILVNTRNCTIIDRIVLFTKIGGGEMNQWHEGNISEELMITQTYYSYLVRYEGDRLIEESLENSYTNQYKITENGYVVMQDNKLIPRRPW